MKDNFVISLMNKEIKNKPTKNQVKDQSKKDSVTPSLMSNELKNKPIKEKVQDQSKRDFVTTAAFTTAGVGAVCLVLPMIDSMNPAADVAALASVEVDISNIKVGEEKKVMWRGKPVFIKRREKWAIEDAQKVKLDELKDPENDSDRVKKGKEEWLVTVGICTHLGCIPIGDSGEFKGWFCPCHGSQYDTSGRIRKGPAPKNLAIPPYEFISENIIKIG